MSARAYMKSQRFMSDKKVAVYFIALLYPFTIGTSIIYALKGPQVKHAFHPHRSHINISSKSEEIQNRRKHIIDHVFKIYNGVPDRQTEHIYDKESTFEDPTIYCKGKKSITALIHGLPCIFRDLSIENEEIEHYEDAIVLKFDATVEFGNFFRKTLPCTQYLELNEKNNKIEKHVDMWNDTPMFEFKGLEKAVKYINGNYICRVVFGLPSGRFIE